MSDEANGVDAGEQQVSSLFGDGSPPPEPAPGADGKVPQQFLNADGSTNVEALLKSWVDTKAAHTAASQKLAAHEGESKGFDGSWEEYRAQLELESLRETAAKAYPKGEVHENTMNALVQSLHAQGIPTKKAAAAVKGYYETVNGMLPEPMDDAAMRKAAVEALPNGNIIEDDVKSWLGERARGNQFSDGQMNVLKGMLRSADGLSLLHRLSREGKGTMPPSIDKRYLGADTDTRRKELRSKLIEMKGSDFDGPEGQKLLEEFRELGGVQGFGGQPLPQMG